MSCQNSGQPASGSKFQQAMVDQKPAYENKVVRSKAIIRKDKRTVKKPHWI